MNPADISNALIYGIPIISCIGYGYESLMACRGSQRDLDARKKYRSPERTSYATGPSNGLRLAVAQSREQMASARELVDRRYAWRGYQSPGGSDRKASRDRSAQEVTFIVEDRKTIVGTVTLGLDGPHGLLAELTHDGVIARLRDSGRRVCELTRLAIAESADSKAVLASLLGLAHYVGRSMHDATDVFIEVNPRHVGFYSRVLGFVVAAGEKVCERVLAPSVLLRLELDRLEDRLKRSGLPDIAPPLVAAA
jgi:hypothetical protein